MKKIEINNTSRHSLFYTASIELERYGRFYAIIEKGVLYLTKFADVATKFNTHPRHIPEIIDQGLWNAILKYPKYRYDNCVNWKWEYKPITSDSWDLEEMAIKIENDNKKRKKRIKG